MNLCVFAVLFPLCAGIVRKAQVAAEGSVDIEALAEGNALDEAFQAAMGDVDLEDAEDADPAHADKGKCWRWCDHGSCEWSRWGCRCACEDNYHGSCCSEMTKCSASTEECCPQENLKQKDAQCADLMTDLGKTIQVGSEGLPLNMQGIFWLTNQGDSSSILTFARTNDGCNTANPASLAAGEPLKVRVGGDRSWAFSDLAKSWKLIEMVDLTYLFHVVGQKMTIIPHAVNWGWKVPKWLMQFDAQELDLTNEDEADRGYVKPDDSVARRFIAGGSKIWRRVSYYWFFGRKEAESFQYDLVQIVDGQGNKLSPAFEEWVAFCGSDAAGKNPGKYFYHEAN